MNTDRYGRSQRLQPASLAAAAALSAAMVGGLVLSSPAVQEATIKTLTGVNIAAAPLPTPELRPRVAARTRVVPRPTPVDPSLVPILDPAPAPYTPALPGPSAGPGAGGDLLPLPIPSPAPVLTDPAVDPRFANDFQPPYPPGEQRAEREGTVTIRVLVGADGRVKEAERVAAASDAFWSATLRQALARWRFRPATRDGVPVEGWRTMTVRFVLAG